ncbi:MAG TPA: PspC domain-containing protein [Bacillota bacterium]
MGKRLYRSRKDTMIAGVAAGMAEYFHLDPTVVRLAWVLLLFAGPGLPAYLLAALIIPVEPAGFRTAAPAGRAGDAAGAQGANVGGAGVSGEGDDSGSSGDAGAAGTGGAAAGGSPAVGGGGTAGGENPARHDGSRTFGWILIIIGAFFLLERFTWIRWERFWPVALILLGLYLIFGRMRDPR